MAQIKPLRGTHILSLALNLPGPAALMRLKALGASCTKLESPVGDPMNAYSRQAYEQMHKGIKIVTADLKTERGIEKLHKLLANTNILLTSFRPSALARLGLSWKVLHKAHPHLSMISIVGDTAAPEVPGHDLTYMAKHGLITGLELPRTLFADMGGSLLAVEAALAAVLHQRTSGRSSTQTVGLSQAAQYLALPQAWRLTTTNGMVGGACASYSVLRCKDGRVAIAALEPHFQKRLAQATKIDLSSKQHISEAAMRSHLQKFMKNQSCKALMAIAVKNDLPIYVMSDTHP